MASHYGHVLPTGPERERWHRSRAVLALVHVSRRRRGSSGNVPGALLAKVDIESAYRLVPVHPTDRPLQAMEWGGAIYVDPMLPFGLRSAPKIFNALADGLEWCLQHHGIQNVAHCLDDFIVFGPPHSHECARDLERLEDICADLGIPLAQHKREGPTTCLTFLGIEVDTVAFELRLPRENWNASNPYWLIGVIGRCAIDGSWSP